MKALELAIFKFRRWRILSAAFLAILGFAIFIRFFPFEPLRTYGGGPFHGQPEAAAESMVTSDGLVFITFFPDKAHKEVRCSAISFQDYEFELLVIDNGPSRAKTTFHKLGEAMQHLECSAGTNGGFFDVATFMPNGLMISSGRPTGSFEPKNWADGLLLVRNGEIRLEDRDSFHSAELVTQLVQTGPWLIQDGVPRSEFKDDSNSCQRTFIVTDGHGRWLLGQVSQSTLSGLVGILLSPSFKAVFPVRSALNLDGGPSSGFWVRKDKSDAYYLGEGTPVRNFIGIKRRAYLK